MIVTNRPITHTIRPRSCRNSYLLPILDNHPDPFTVFAFFFLPRDLLLLPTLSPIPSISIDALFFTDSLG